ncbi:MAG: hypothetical protein ABSG62_02565 [Terracidiphilus sp.]|jgi:hypothetical protein
MAKCDAKYVGLSLGDARAALATQVKSGTRQDGTKLHPKVQETLAQLSGKLEQAELIEATHYVVCWSEGCVIVIDHPFPDPGPIRTQQ